MSGDGRGGAGGARAGARVWRRYVAIGDSFTEGLCDPDPERPGAYRGWADRLAETLDSRARAAGGPPLQYANLAVRGRLLGRILDEQLPVALASAPDLVSISGGGNDILRPRVDVDALLDRLDGAVAATRATGADVLLFTGIDPRALPVVRLARGRVAAYNASLWSVAARHGAVVVDLWGLRALYDLRLWAPDRIHLSPEGHRRVAALAAATLLAGARDEEWARPLAPLPAQPRREVVQREVTWARDHLGPWVGRRVRGVSTGDTVVAKRPQPGPLRLVPREREVPPLPD